MHIKYLSNTIKDWCEADTNNYFAFCHQLKRNILHYQVNIDYILTTHHKGVIRENTTLCDYTIHFKSFPQFIVFSFAMSKVSNEKLRCSGQKQYKEMCYDHSDNLKILFNPLIDCAHS